MINLKDVGRQIIDIARKMGCGAQVTMMESHSREIALRKGEIEKLLTSVAVSTGIRLFKDNKSTILAFSGEDFDNMEKKLSAVMEDLRYLSDDPYKRLLNNSEYGDQPQDLELADDVYETLDIKELTRSLEFIEKTALDCDSKLIPSEMAEFSGSRGTVYLFTSEGLEKSYKRTLYDFSYVAVAQDGQGKETDYWYERTRHFKEMPAREDLGKIGKIAAERAIKRLSGKRVKTGEYKVLFSRRTAGSLLDLLGDAMDGEEVVLKNSFLLDALGKKLFPESITVIDNPLKKRFPGSYPFDGEGMNGKAKAVVERGTFTSYLHNSYSAGKLNMALTANASRALTSVPHITIGNFYLEGGSGTQEDLMAEMKDGLVVEDLYVSGHNSVTGDFSFGCAGFLVENGVITTPVKEITVAGNILDIFKNIVAVADDNLFKASLTSPSFLVSKLTVAGM